MCKINSNLKFELNFLALQRDFKNIHKERIMARVFVGAFALSAAAGGLYLKFDEGARRSAQFWVGVMPAYMHYRFVQKKLAWTKVFSILSKYNYNFVFVDSFLLVFLGLKNPVQIAAKRLLMPNAMKLTTSYTTNTHRKSRNSHCN